MPLQSVVPPLALALLLLTAAGARAQPTTSSQPVRPRVGIALGGGSARGLAHVGVLRWLEEHRVPIDVLAGTSMWGLIGGAYASGMSPDEIEALLADTDWDAMFRARTSTSPTSAASAISATTRRTSSSG